MPEHRDILNVKAQIENCNACGLCLVSCPVWRQHRDMFLTFPGRMRALQAGAELEELTKSLSACLLCGSCKPACPRGINTVEVTLALREGVESSNPPLSPTTPQSTSDSPKDIKTPDTKTPDTKTPDTKTPDTRTPETRTPETRTPETKTSDTRTSDTSAVFLPGEGLRNHPALIKRALALLGLWAVSDDGMDVLQAFEQGRVLDAQRQDSFHKGFQAARRVVTPVGMFHAYGQVFLPGLKVEPLGQALLLLPEVLGGLKETDFYVIETRAYNSGFNKASLFYADIRARTGCAMNVDLQRVAIPTGTCRAEDAECRTSPDIGEHVRWILEGWGQIKRIVVEAVDDIEAFEAATDVPVIHVAELSGEVLA